MHTPQANDEEARRRAARRTALWTGLAALGVYLVFILSGIFGATGMKT